MYSYSVTAGGPCSNLFLNVAHFFNTSLNRTAHIRHLCMKTAALSFCRCVTNTGVEKNELHLNVD